MVREGRSTSEFRSQRIASLIAAIGLVIATSASTPTARAWVYFVAWAITMPLFVFAYARWSLGVLARDPVQWRESVVNHRRVETGRAVLYFFLSVLPAAVLFAVFAEH